MSKIGYATAQTDDIIFICAKISKEQLKSLRNKIHVYDSDLGKGRYLLEMPRNDENVEIALKFLTDINGSPIKDEPIVPLVPFSFTFKHDRVVQND